MTFSEIKLLIIEKLGEAVIVAENTTLVQPQLTISSDRVIELCLFLRDSDSLFFDYLSCLTGLDNGSEKNSMEVIYHLYSIPYNHSIILKVELDRSSPSLPSVSSIWRTADWHEREAYDMYGITFIGHPDLRRILLPADWEGFPLRKDYEEQEYYHGIKVKY